MALNTPQLENAIFDLLSDQAERTENPVQARRDFAHQLAVAITTHIKTGVVTTTGSASAQTGKIE